RLRFANALTCLSRSVAIFVPFVAVGPVRPARLGEDDGNLAGCWIDFDTLDRRLAVADGTQRARNFTLIEAVHTTAGPLLGHGCAASLDGGPQSSSASPGGLADRRWHFPGPPAQPRRRRFKRLSHPAEVHG